ncbi:MAG: biopolymer transporter ExbD [Planctomycetota bacterium]
MRFTRTTDDVRGGRLPLIGMIDVFFLLLVYFLTSATITPAEEELAAALSAERTDASAANLEPQVVVVGDRSVTTPFTVSGTSIPTQARLTELLSGLPKEPGVFVRADDAARVADVAAALQACNDAGFERITYVAPE